MIISPPFLPVAGMTSTNLALTDPMMSVVDEFELAHGVYPIAFDRRWHTGVHLYPATQNEKVRAIADGEVVAYRVCQHAIDGGTPHDSNAGFVLLKHTSETGDGRTLTFYSLYMHLLALSAYSSVGVDGNVLPEFLRLPSPGGSLNPSVAPPAQAGGGKKVSRKDVLGLPGACHGQRHIHFEIFMLPEDFDRYFGATQLENAQPHTPAGTDYWGHSYYIIPAGQTFVAQPPGTVNGKLHGITFDPLHGGQNTLPLHVESYFHRGSKYTSVWSVAADGSRIPLVTNKQEPEYEYKLYERATKLYPTCPSDGYELLRFGRILSASPSLPAGAAKTTWIRAAFAAGQEGYIDLNNEKIAKLSDDDFPCLANWQKVSEGNSPFASDGLCDIDRLKAILGTAKEHQTQQEQGEHEEYQKEEALVRYVRNTAGVRDLFKGFVCQAPSEWDGANNDARYGKLLSQQGEFYYGDSAGYGKFMALLKQFQFWDVTHLQSGTKLWFFHPLQFIRYFRRCGWLSHGELTATFPRHMFYTSSGNPRTATTTNNTTYTLSRSEASSRVANHVTPLNDCIRKYIGCSKQRQAIFLSQALLETAQWRNLGETKRLMHEWGFGAYSSANPATQYYTAFYGRGIMQLTWAGNYDLYGQFKNFPPHTGSYIERKPNITPRITNISQHYNFNPSNHGHLMQWSPRFDPDIVAENRPLACDSGGFYWVSKSFSEGININRVADRPYSAANTGFVNRLVNGGANGYDERQAYTAFMLQFFTDDVSNTYGQLISPPGRASIQPDMTTTA
ncbi:hypothetical protein R69927_00959 [Paraburkholderia domus]|uniref:M23 family metallopeptidase n=1 Tax=Paraburkholderia domus TaxID=2793075 RepID=UPI001911C482|nr:M23 family metallopeptidase [Paraburkholderia domus]MBK5085298.1 peptidase M23 [Burkholderia sp. R-69927]CAE6827553.1 hypothetical protein R69927_00959 [Paraburkholderia domus]